MRLFFLLPLQHARHGFNSQIDRAAIRRTDYLAMGGNQLVTESQAHKWYRQALTDNGSWAKEEEALLLRD